MFFNEITNDREALQYIYYVLKVEERTPREVAAEITDLGIMIKELEDQKQKSMFDVNSIIGMYLVQQKLYAIYNIVLDSILEDEHLVKENEYENI